MNKHKIANVELIKLIDYFKSQPKGADLTYLQIEQETGISMDTAGKALMRKAVSASERVYKVRTGVGIWLDCLENATEIVTIKTKRVRTSMVKTIEAIKIVKPVYYRQLPKSEQQLMDMRESLISMTLSQEKEHTLKKQEIKILPQNDERIKYG